MPALPLEERIEKLPNWAQAYIGRLTRQILKLTDRANTVSVDPSPVFSVERAEDGGEDIQNFLQVPNDVFHVEAERGTFTIRLTSTGLQIISSTGKIALAPVGSDGIDVVLVGKS